MVSPADANLEKRMSSISTANASSDADFEQILALQRRYLRQALTAREQSEEGFVYLQHDAGLLRRMAAALPQAIALADGRVVGYCLSLSTDLRRELPGLEPMFAQFERCSYGGRPLLSYRLFVGGQVCVERDFRGQGLAGRLYHQARRSLPERYDLCVTEIAARNRVSIASHEKVGFRPLLSYSDGTEDWVVVAWDLEQAPIDDPSRC
jgi:GNAT superfamily N-acetyltransferase